MLFDDSHSSMTPRLEEPQAMVEALIYEANGQPVVLPLPMQPAQGVTMSDCGLGALEERNSQSTEGSSVDDSQPTALDTLADPAGSKEWPRVLAQVACAVLLLLVVAMHLIFGVCVDEGCTFQN